MKLFPSLTLATLCAAFAGCTATTQTITFPDNPEQSGVLVSIDGQEIGSTPVSYTVNRTKTPVVYKVVYSKPGYVAEEAVIDSWEDADGLCSFMDDYPVPVLVESEEGDVAPAPVQPTIEGGDDEQAPAPAGGDAPETGTAGTDDGVVAPVDNGGDVGVEDPKVDAPEGGETAPEPVNEGEPTSTIDDHDTGIDEPAPVPAGEDKPTTDGVETGVAQPTETPKGKEKTPATEPAPQPAKPVVEPEKVVAVPVAPAPKTEKTPALDPRRTLKDIESDLANLRKMRMNGEISEKEFQKAISALKAEVDARYNK